MIDTKSSRMKILGLIFVITIALVSCSNGDDGCGAVPNSEFDITGFDIDVGTYSGEIELGNSLSLTPINPGDNIVAEEFVIELIATTNSLAKNSKEIPSTFDFSVIRKVHACSPAAPFTHEKISNMTITSLTDFSPEHPAGTSLNQFFDVVFNDRREFKLDNGETSAYNLDEFIATIPNGSQLTQLKLNTAPSVTMSHEFFIEYSHVNGESFSMTVPLVVFN